MLILLTPQHLHRLIPKLVVFLSVTSLWISGTLRGNTEIFSTREILPPKAFGQIPLLSSRSFSIDDQEQVWILGEKDLWKWDVPNQKIFKIPLLEGNSSDHLEQMEVYPPFLTITTRKHLFLIHTNPWSIKQFDSENLNDSLGIQKNDRSLFWVKKDGIYQISMNDFSLKKIHRIDLSTLHAPVFYEPSENKLLFMDNKELKAQVLTKESSMSLWNFGEILPLKIIFQENQPLLVPTPYYVLQKSPVSSSARTIPVLSQRKILDVAANSDAHAYLFNDGKLEVKDLHGKITKYYELDQTHRPFQEAKQIGHLVLRGNLLGYREDQSLRLYQLESTP